MKIPSKEQIQMLKNKYPKGTRVELAEMDDPQAPPIGTKGTVLGIDDLGSLMVSWDNGSSLHVLLNIDSVIKLP